MIAKALLVEVTFKREEYRPPFIRIDMARRSLLGAVAADISKKTIDFGNEEP